MFRSESLCCTDRRKNALQLIQDKPLGKLFVWFHKRHIPNDRHQRKKETCFYRLIALTIENEIK
jgi:hypothetical protein